MGQDTNYLKAWESLFVGHRPFLMAYAFRMLGSLAEAEDVVQDTFLQCGGIDPGTIDNHRAWLVRVCSNRGLDHLKSASKKRESYHGTWLPDAVPDAFQIWSQLENAGAPDRNLRLAESLTTSFLVMIEKLSPEERVVYLLSEVFDYPFKEIAGFLEKSEAACRKIAERARKAMASRSPKGEPPSAATEAMILGFFNTAKSGDQAKLAELLSADSEFWADGGGKVSASAGILEGPAKIARFFGSLGAANALDWSKNRVELCRVNSQPGLVVSRETAPGSWVFDTIFTFQIANGKIDRIFAQRNPDKLAHLLRLGNH